MPLKAAKTQAPGLDQPEAGKNARKADDVVINDDEHLRDLIFELGLWVRGLEVYCASERQVFPNRTKQDNAERNYRGEFQITQAVLIRCSEMIGEINRTGTGGGFVKHETAELEQAVRTLAALNSSLCRNPTLNFIEWNAWCKVAGEGLSSTALYGAFDAELVDAGKRF
ncbi:MAG: hypothetical protein ACJ72Z_11495 [Pyrinomonadaceae bacterium]